MESAQAAQSSCPQTARPERGGGRSFLRKKPSATRFPFVGSDKPIYAVDSISPNLLHCLMEVHSPLDVSLLTRAVHLTLSQTPILKSVARLRWFAPFWEVLDDLTPHPILTVRDLTQEAGAEGAAADITERFINEYIDVTQSPPVRFLLGRLSAGRWLFVAKAHHCLLDVAAFLYMIEDVRTFYQKLLRGEPLPPAREMGGRDRGLLFRRVSLSLWGHAVLMAARRKISGPRLRRKVFVRFSQPGGAAAIAHRSVHFAGKEYTSFRARCKSLGVTANELLLAALCRTIYKWNGSGDPPEGFYSITMPVDLRRYARHKGTVPRIMSNFVGNAGVSVPVRAVKTLEDAVAWVVHETRFIKDHHVVLLRNLSLLWSAFVPPRWLRWAMQKRYERRPDQFVPTAIVSNAGRVDRILLPSADFAIHRIEGVGRAFSPAGLVVVALSYLRQQTITVTYRKDVCPEKEIDGFVELFAEELLPGYRASRDGAG
ncbi:MAG TPA: condensation domain-containing protein [Candidatus Binatia bacterium]|nr:condensation domain-containing protein [Candidatus Binatia bacterium]